MLIISEGSKRHAEFPNVVQVLHRKRGSYEVSEEPVTVLSELLLSARAATIATYCDEKNSTDF